MTARVELKGVTSSMDLPPFWYTGVKSFSQLGVSVSVLRIGGKYLMQEFLLMSK